MNSDRGTKSHPEIMHLMVTTVTHILLLMPVIYIIVLYSQSYNFFSWHPICMSIGVGLLIIEGVFCISGEATLTNRLSRENRVTLHWILNSIGLTLMFLGLIIIMIQKNRSSQLHFTTTHGQFGLSSIIIASVVALSGILAKNTRWLYPIVRSIPIKFGHTLGGIAISILFIATIINGTYKSSFPGIDTGRSLCFTSFFFAALLVLFKPILEAISRSRMIWKPTS